MKNDVTVLMSTYNGENYLLEQVESVLKQERVNVHLLVRDDGSTDNTKNLLTCLKNQGKLDWYTGQNLRTAQSFLNLVKKSPNSSYYAFCDQDDVWKPEKLSRALEFMGKHDQSQPVMYCAGYQMVDEKMIFLPDNGHISTTTFGAALVASNATGCTIVFNRKLRDIINLYTPATVVMHDDWMHKVCLAVGGTVIYDKYKALYYRQHGNNVDGGRRSVFKRIKLICNRIKQKDCIRSKQIGELIKGYSDMMPTENVELAKKVIAYNNSLTSKLDLVLDKDIKTPYSRFNRGFALAILLGYF